MRCQRGHDAWRFIKQGEHGRERWRCVICKRAAQVRSLVKHTALDPAYPLWRAARRRSREKLLPCPLTRADVRAVYPADGRCPVLGLRLKPGKGFSSDASPTLDRLNPEWGYEPGNIAVISMRANRIKGNAEARELDRVAAWMRSHGLT